MVYKLSIDMLLSICNFVVSNHGKLPDDVLISQFYEALMKVLNSNKNESDSDESKNDEYISIDSDSDN